MIRQDAADSLTINNVLAAALTVRDFTVG